MKILVNSNSTSIQEKSSYSGAHIFSRDFLNYYTKTGNTFSALSFLRPEKSATHTFTVDRIKKGKNNWLIFRTLISTDEIMTLLNKRPLKKVLDLVDLLAEEMKNEKADLFMLNGFSAIVCLLLHAARRAKLPIVSIHHGLWFKESEALLNHLSAADLAKRKKLEKQIAQFADKNIFLNMSTVREYEKVLGKISRKQIKIIPLPYNPIFLNRKLPAPNKGKTKKIGIVARWDRIKNHDAFLALATEAQKQNLPWEFYAVTKIEHYPPYNSIAREYKKSVKIVSQVTPRLLKKFYQKMDLIVVPSRFETYSAVAMEALFQNRPVVVSKHVPWAETFKKHGLGAWVADFQNSPKTVKILAQVLKQNPPKTLINSIIRDNNPARIYRECVQTLLSVIK